LPTFSFSRNNLKKKWTPTSLIVLGNPAGLEQGLSFPLFYLFVLAGELDLQHTQSKAVTKKTQEAAGFSLSPLNVSLIL